MGIPIKAHHDYLDKMLIKINPPLQMLHGTSNLALQRTFELV